MKTYSQQEVDKLIKEAREEQKAEDYQKAGELLIGEDEHLEQNIIKLLDYLASTG